MFVSLQFKLEFENKQGKGRVLSLMHLQSSAIRFIYNTLKEGKKTEIYKLAKRLSPYQRAGFGRLCPGGIMGE